LLSIAAAKPVAAQSWEGVVTLKLPGNLSVNDGEIHLYAEPRFVVAWKLWVLAGEPVVDCEASWFLTSASINEASSHDFCPDGAQGSCWGSRSDAIPPEVLRQIRPLKGVLRGVVSDPTYNQGDWKWLSCDLGILNEPYTRYERRPELAIVKGWSDAERRRYGGYNTPESPSWDRLLHSDAAATVFLSRETAQAHVREEVAVRPSPLSFVEVDAWNLQPVHSWLAERRAKWERGKAEEKRRQARRLRERAESRGKQKEKEDSFFDRPTNAATHGEHKETTRLEAEAEAILSKADSAVRAAASKSAGYERWASDKRADIDGRPPPGLWPQLVRHCPHYKQCGYRLPDGRVHIAPKFDEVDEKFTAGFARARKASGWGVISSSGSWVLRPEFSDVILLGADRFGATRKYGEPFSLYDTSGKALAGPFSTLEPFSEGLAAAGASDKVGFIDPAGRWVIHPQFSAVDAFKGGSARFSNFIGRRDETGSSCPGHYAIHDVGRIDRTGQIIEGPRREDRYMAAICLESR
jgi:hypothetical protein